jgi:hypothetical protein
VSAHAPADRIRTLLLGADNVLKNAGDPADRERRARAAPQEAGDVVTGGGVDPRVAQLIDGRLAALEDDGPR